MKMQFNRWILFLFLWSGTLFSQTPGFNPIGKTEAEVTSQWGHPTSRMDLGSESHLVFSVGTVIFEDGTAVTFKPSTKAGVSTSSGGTSARVNTPEPTEQKMSTKQREREEQDLQISRLDSELQEKRKELDEKKNSREKQEIMDRFEEGRNRLNSNYYNSKNYSIQLANLEKHRDDDLEQLERRLGIKDLEADIKRLETEISEKRRSR